ncbi:MAG: Uma2 family endonuclease [Oculatellaceae cyanobacterium Prado106]|jgi:Uma2 family endonuclease|nr:Uma2 family endonuclease [Oculatellaceae cyanobacterium Prado106]
MYTTATQSMTFEEFLAWDDGTGRDYELRDGFPMPVVDPNAKHEDVADELCVILAAHCKDLNLPYIPKRQKQVMTGTHPVSGREESRRADIVVFDQAEWERMRQTSISAAAYVPPPLLIEVVSTNWRDDYDDKFNEYEALGVPEYWIVDFAGLGGIRYIGSPKQPTITIYRLIEGEYFPKQFRGEDRLESETFQSLSLTANQVFEAGR